MTPPLVSSFYAGLLAILAIFLSMRVVRLRMKTGVGIGDKGEPDLKRSVRVHANFSEYDPLALVLLALLEMVGFDLSNEWDKTRYIHGLGITLVAARLLHAIGLSRKPGMSLPRGAGHMLTLLVMFACAGMLILGYVSPPN